MATPRYLRLLAWNVEHTVSFGDIGEQLSMTANGARQALMKPRIYKEHHKKLLALGFPSDLLPEPCDEWKGRRKRAPNFPGLQAQA